MCVIIILVHPCRTRLAPHSRPQTFTTRTLDTFSLLLEGAAAEQIKEIIEHHIVKREIGKVEKKVQRMYKKKSKIESINKYYNKVSRFLFSVLSSRLFMDENTLRPYQYCGKKLVCSIVYMSFL